jgi:hypothetical protein
MFAGKSIKKEEFPIKEKTKAYGAGKENVF